MAHAVIGGLITSTLLTLFVVPVAYTLLDDLAEWARSKRKVRVGHGQPPIGVLADASASTPA